MSGHSRYQGPELPAAGSAGEEGDQGCAGGGTLQVLATDPGAVRDFEAFCRSTGNQLVDWSEEAGVFTFNIKKVA